jgi:L-ascorbate metabolism protein UlaG (beta-lactamase superfamily)
MIPLVRAARIGRKFQAPVPTTVGGASMIFKVLPLYLSNKQERTPKVALGPFVTDTSAYLLPPRSGLRVTWFGHASLLIEIDGVTVLADPVWDGRAAPVSFAGPKRFFPPTLPLEDLPRVDAVLISHDHYDHLGRETVKALAVQRPSLRWIVPLEVAKILVGFGVNPSQITELDWMEETFVRSPESAELRITALPTRHFSGRSPWNRNETLWMSFLLQGSWHKVYHGVDSGLWPGYETIAAQYGPFDLTLLEIGAFNELWRDIHLGPDGAVEAFHALGGGILMPIHWGLFDLALHAWRQPIERVTQLADEQGITLFSPEPGLPAEVLSGRDLRSSWWRLQS